MSLLEYGLLALTGLGTAALTAVAGFGGGTILMGVLLLFMQPAAAIPFHGAVQLVSNGWRVLLFRRHIAWGIALRFCALLPFGVLVGLWFFQGLSAALIQALIGGVVLFTLFARRLKRFRNRDLPIGAFWPLGFVTGILNMMVGVVAPLMGVLVVRRDLDKEAMIATLGLFALAGHVGKVIAFGAVGFDFAHYAVAFAVMAPSVMVGGVVGKWLLGRVPERAFQIVFQLLLIALAVKLLVWEGLFKLL